MLQSNIEQNLIGNMIIEWCRQKAISNDIIFDLSCCTQTRIIRFTTKELEKYFPSKRNSKGFWKNGHFSFYEIVNNLDEFYIRLVVSIKDLSKNELELLRKLVNDELDLNKEYIIVNQWRFDVSKANDRLVVLTDELLNDLKNYLNNLNTELILYEGSITEVFTNKYERNKVARQKCLDYHGYTCKICGFNFEKVYGDKFKHCIEVHHIVPLNQIKGKYVVNPITDLIPVCPNCHFVLHSCKDGVYTPDDVIEFIRK